MFQASAYTEKQVQHYNLTEEEVYEKVRAGWKISAIGSPSSEKTGAGSVSKKGKRRCASLRAAAGACCPTGA